MVGGDHLDLLAEHAAAKILHRHLGGLERPFAAVGGIDPGLIVQNADLDALRRRGRGKYQAAYRDGSRQQSRFHMSLPKPSNIDILLPRFWPDIASKPIVLRAWHAAK